jgi:prepilin-type N-terminal cleavage/methylation domain-containing protein
VRYASTKPRRPAFTLIELLVVIAIIAILAALVAGAVFRVMASQAIKRSEATVKKIQTGLSGQWQAVIDNVKDELKSPPTSGTDYKMNAYLSAKNLANGDPARMRALYVKLRLIQEFPQSFAEALASGKQTYLTAISGAPSPGPTVESAVCLYLAINQGRRGATFNNEDVGPGSVKSVPGGAGTLNYYVDAWGQPITYQRWITNDSDPLVAELSAPPYAPTQGSKDKDDPEGALYTAKTGWNQTNMNQAAQVVGHPITAGQPLNRGPVVRSAGPNKNLGDGDDILGFRLMKEGQRGGN